MDYHTLLNSGELYNSVDDELISYQHFLVQKINDFNNTPETPEGLLEREKILRETVGTYGDGLYIIPPVYANNGLHNVHFGKGVIVNFNCSFVDDADIFIGDNTMIGPQVSIITAQHPISPKLRENNLQYNKPVHIGKNVWIGAGALILPGVTIGDNSVVGAGSVVTRDVEENCIVVGSPARVLRKITEKDDLFYDGDKEIPEDIRMKYL